MIDGEDPEFFRALVENGSDAVVSIDEDSTVVFANSAVERVFGYEPEELVGESLTAVMPDRFVDAHHAAIASYIRTGERTLDWNDIQLPAEHADGHEVPLSITFEEHVYDGKRIFSGIMRDVSARREYERTLEALQDAGRDLLRARSPETVGRVVVEAARDALGLERAAIYVTDTGGLELAAATDAPGSDTESGTATGGDVEPDPADWPPTPATLDLSTVVGGDTTHARDGLLLVPVGDRGGLVLDTGGEVGERTRRLATILAANAETALTRAEREAALERQNERLERFASVVSHDLRDPLNAANAQLALAREAAEGETPYLDELDAIHDRMNEIIEDILTLTRKGEDIDDTEPVAVGTVAEEAWTTAGADGDGAALVLEAPPTVEADAGRLRTLFENLLGNAVRHGGADVTVEVGALADGPGFYVADDGPGVDPEDRQRVFEYGVTDGGGSGLGLSIVREVAAAHGWRVDLVEGAAGGARFEVRTDGRRPTDSLPGAEEGDP